MVKHSAARPGRVQEKDYTVHRVMGALALLVVSIFLLKKTAAALSTLDGFERVYPLTTVGWIVGLILTLACAAVWIVCKGKPVRTAAGFVMPVMLLGTFSALIFHNCLTDKMALLYFVHAAAYCLFVIAQLYGTEFFMVSLMTALAGWTFYLYFPGITLSFRPIFWGVLLALSCAVCVLLACRCHAGKGSMLLLGKRLHLFPRSFSPVLICAVGGVWLVCLLASLVLGSMFAYCCMFAAIAVELIAAVYYTFQLK